MTPTAAPAQSMRIGELAEAVGTTPRTIRYYEEIGLLPDAGKRAAGRHRTYTEADAERLREVMRLKDLLGVSLEELRELVEAEDARAELRRKYHESDDPARRREILTEALGHIGNQLELVRRRQRELGALEDDLLARRRRVRRRLAEHGGS
jgi:MerR family transcriptional regulator, repressor of the yfmOP operon